MSAINNVITTTYRASPGNTVQVSQGVARGWGTIARSIDNTTRMSERLNNQWRAIGTTFRYAVAGSLIFGTAQLGANLKDLQRQMGLLQALGNTTNGIFPNTGGGRFGIKDLLADARTEAVRSRTPINDFNEGLINLFSSIEKVPENRAAAMMREISLTAQLAQTDSETASRAITGMLQTFGLDFNEQNIQKMTRAMTELIVSVPGGKMAAGQIFQQFPQLAASFQLGGGTIQQMMGFYMTLLRSGGTPATGGRGLQFLAQTLATPETQTAESRKALASIGITSKFIEERGVGAAIGKLIAHIRGGISLPKRAAGSTLTDDDIEAMFPEGSASLEGMTKLGITGERAQFLAHAVPRIHGVRAAVLLATRPDTTDADLKAIDDMWKGYAADIAKHRKRMQNLTGPRHLEAATIALSGIAQQVSLAVEPYANLASRGIVRIHEGMEGHPKAVERGTQIALGLGAVLGARRFLRGGGIMGKGGAGMVGAMAARDLDNMTRGHSPQLPLYVTVVGEIFGTPLVGGNQTPIVPGPGKSLGDKITRWGTKAGITRAGMAVVGTTAAALGAAAYASDQVMTRTGMADEATFSRKNFRRAAGDIAGFVQSLYTPNYTRDELLRNRFGPNVVGFSNPAQGTFKGDAMVWLTIDLKKEDGTRTQKRVKVPLSLWQGGKSPSTLSRPGSVRGGD